MPIPAQLTLYKQLKERVKTVENVIDQSRCSFEEIIDLLTKDLEEAKSMLREFEKENPDVVEFVKLHDRLDRNE